MNPQESEYLELLIDIFPNRTRREIEDAIESVITETPGDDVQILINDMINILADTTAVAAGQGYFNNSEDCSPIIGIREEDLTVSQEQLLSIFPDASPSYVKKLCLQKAGKCSFDDLVDEMTKVDYPKKESTPNEIFMHLKDMLPNADPSFLEREATALAYSPEADLKKFVEDAIETGDYPTMTAYLKNKKEQEEIDQYTIDFNIKHFLTQFPDPEKYFLNPSRKQLLASNSETADDETLEEEELYALTFLYNYYGYLRKKDIDKVFRRYSKNLFTTCSRLDTMRKAMVVPRQVTVIDKFPRNIPLLQEIAYLKHRKQIKTILKEYDIHYRQAKEQARLHGLLQTCACCFDNELIPEECFFCKNGCIFCKECLKSGAENVIGDGKLDFPCLADCDSEFSISTLQMVLDSVVFSRMAQRKQMEEVKHAALDGLESCPFCEFSTIPSPDDKIFRCLNSYCLEESCRECRHEAHIPLRCSEIEYDEDVRMRTYIENKMTEALLRKCWQCNKVFIKESGCNKMTCSCGAAMCYVCGVAVTNYTHFGESNSQRCPLYTTDLNKFHADAVMRGANRAKNDLGVNKNPTILKNDPTVGIENHF